MELDVEYCGTCGYAKKYDELSEAILQKFPQVKMNGHEGRRASFEVKLNGTLIHSKLSTMAFPDYDDVSSIITDVYDGKNVRPVNVRQPITDCVLL